jgi:hypothetical protein
VPSTQRTTTALRVLFLTRITSSDPKLCPPHRTRLAPRSEITATTCPSPPSLHWPLVFDQSPTPTTSSQTFRSTTTTLTPTSDCRLTTSLSRRLAATSITWRPTSHW